MKIFSILVIFKALRVNEVAKEVSIDAEMWTELRAASEGDRE